MTSILNSNALVDFDEAKEFLKIPLANTEQDSLVYLFINMASERIETFCNRKFIAQDYTVYRDGDSTHRILLDQWPINSITNLWIDSERIFGASSLIDASDYALDYNEKDEAIGIVYLDKRFTRGIRNIKIEYNAGYQDPTVSEIDIPNDVRGACLFLTQFYYKRQQNQDITVTSKTKGDETIGIHSDIPLFVQGMLHDYKREEFVGFTTSTRSL